MCIENLDLHSSRVIIICTRFVKYMYNVVSSIFFFKTSQFVIGNGCNHGLFM